MKINLDSPAEEVQIQLIPLIDVIFCILTFFILAALGLTRQQSISVDLPQAKTGVAPAQEMLIVSIDPIGQTFIEKQPVTRQELYQKLQDYHRQRPDGLLVLYASRTAIYEDVVQVVDMLRSVGGDRVALATLPASNQLPGLAPSDPFNPGAPGLAPGTNPGAPGLAPAPGTNPGAPFNPYGNPNLNAPFNPGAPVPNDPGQLPAGQGVNPANPGAVPGTLAPNVPPAESTLSPAEGNTPPNR